MNPHERTTEFGELKCHIVDQLTDDAPSLLVVLSHGFGASGTDLVGLADPLLGAAPQIASGVRFIFPEAPLDMGPMGLPGGRAWWPFNMTRLMEMHQTSDFSDLIELEPPGLRDASSQLSDAVQAMLADSGLTEDRLLIGGFSQGAMVSTDVVLRTGLNPAALILMSSTLLCRKEWSQLAASHPGCPVIQTHGTIDPLLPFSASELLRDLLTETGFDVQFQSFFGQHTVPPQALQLTAKMIMQKLSEPQD